LILEPLKFQKVRFLIAAPKEPQAKWIRSFRQIAPHIPLDVGGTSPYPDHVQCIMVWGKQGIDYSKFKNLKLIYSMGAGADHIVWDPSVSKKIPICRIVDPQMAFSMSNYIVTAVLNYHRHWYDFIELKKVKQWKQYDYDERELRIGILGLGHLGMDAAKKLSILGHQVMGYSLSPKKTSFPTYSGHQLDAFLSQINVLVCTVPLTTKTKGLLNMELFKKFREPTYLINVARGKIQKEKDILKAIDQGILTGACLDVFETEPLPSDSLLWNHHKIMITPHNASFSFPKEGVHQVLENFRRVRVGEPLLHQVHSNRMY
ncbi:MAG: glyoxylate/hydroxypyruvate reductase A, partial [Flavobacteriaceae bacterium]|nr:glyoxylate/hydroxypyruvate reductase A [Flavobacteriaceae bacterium]